MNFILVCHQSTCPFIAKAVFLQIDWQEQLKILVKCTKLWASLRSSTSRHWKLCFYKAHWSYEQSDSEALSYKGNTEFWKVVFVKDRRIKHPSNSPTPTFIKLTRLVCLWHKWRWTKQIKWHFRRFLSSTTGNLKSPRYLANTERLLAAFTCKGTNKKQQSLGMSVWHFRSTN